MRKPQDWGQPCPNPDCSHYRLINRGNVSAISTYMTQSGKDVSSGVVPVSSPSLKRAIRFSLT